MTGWPRQHDGSERLYFLYAMGLPRPLGKDLGGGSGYILCLPCVGLRYLPRTTCLRDSALVQFRFLVVLRRFWKISVLAYMLREVEQQVLSEMIP